MKLTNLPKRPLAIALFLYLAASFFCLYLRPRFLSWLFPTLLALFLLLAILTVIAYRKREKSAALLVSLLLLFAILLPSGIGMQANARQKELASRFDEFECEAVFKANEIVRHKSVTIAYGILTPAGETEGFRTILTFFKDAKLGGEDDYHEIENGDTVRGIFSLSPVSGNTLSELSLYADGYELSGSYLYGGEIISQGSPRFSLRGYLADAVDNRLGENGSGVIKALLIADKSDLSASTKENFSILGISHLLAVSGLHLTVLIGFIAALFKRYAISQRISIPILSALVIGYAALTDFAPSLLRAGGMLLLFYLSGILRRRRDTLTSLLFATSTIVLINPKAILDIGLLLSFLATLGIIVIALPLTKALTKLSYFEVPTATKRFLLYLSKSAIITVSASVTVLPILFLLSGEIFLLAVFSNLIFAVLFTAILYLLPIFLITLPIPIVTNAVSFILEILSALTLMLAELAKPLSFLSLSLGYGFLPYLFIALFLAALPFFLKEKRAIAFLILASFLFLAPIGIVIDNAILKTKESVSYHADGKNDLLSVERGDRRAAIVFSASGNFVKSRVLQGGLSSPSVTLDTLILPNPQNANAVFLYALWESGGITHIVLPECNTAADYLASFSESLGIKITRFTPNDTVIYNGIKITTHASTKGTTAAVSIALSDHTLLYLKEDAPNDFDIRFGVMQAYHDTVILGCYGEKTKGSLTLLADTVWEYERRSVIPAVKGQHYAYGEQIITVKHKEE